MSKVGQLDVKFAGSGALGDLDMVLRAREISLIHFVNKCIGYYCWSEYRQGRLESFLDNLEVYAKKYMNHPRLSGADGMELRTKFAQSCSGYSIQICRMLLSQHRENISAELQLKIDQHQTAMRGLFGESYQKTITTPESESKSAKSSRILTLLVKVTNKILPANTKRRRWCAPILRGGRILLTEGWRSLGSKTIRYVKKHQFKSQSEEHIPSVPVTQKMRSTKRIRVLVIDEYIPAIRYGAGFPRLYKMLTCLADSGYSTTFFPVLNPVKVQPETSELQQKGIEVFWGNQISFEEFAQARSDYYNVVLISRPPVFKRLFPVVNKWLAKAAILYDAEALFYTRDIAKAEIMGARLQETEKSRMARKEMSLIEKAGPSDCGFSADKGYYVRKLLPEKHRGLGVCPGYH